MEKDAEIFLEAYVKYPFIFDRSGYKPSVVEFVKARSITNEDNQFLFHLMGSTYVVKATVDVGRGLQTFYNINDGEQLETVELCGLEPISGERTFVDSFLFTGLFEMPVRQNISNILKDHRFLTQSSNQKRSFIGSLLIAEGLEFKEARPIANLISMGFARQSVMEFNQQFSTNINHPVHRYSGADFFLDALRQTGFGDIEIGVN